MKKLKDILKESNVQIGKVYSNPYAKSFVKEEEEERPQAEELTTEQKHAFLEAVKQFKKYGEAVYRNAGLGEVYESIKNMVEMAGKVTISETDDWFDNVTVSRHMKRMGESFKVFEKTLKEVSTLQQRLEASYDEIGEVLGKYYEINEAEEMEEGNEFGAARAKAIANGDDSFEVDGKKYPVKDVDKDDKENAKEFTKESMKLTDMISVNEAKSIKTYNSLDDFEKIAKIGNVFYLGKDDQFQLSNNKDYFKVVGKKTDGTLVVSRTTSNNKFTIGADRYDEKVHLVKESVVKESEEAEEENEFGAARAKAIANGDDSFEVDGKKYPVKDVDKDDKENAKEFTKESMKLTDMISVNEASEEFVVYVEKDNGRKKLLHTKQSQRAANMFLTKNADKILNQSGIRTIGSMSKFHWEKDEAQYAENIKKTDMKTVTKKEWDSKHKDYKGMIKGQPYMMYMDKNGATVYGPVNIKESVVNESSISIDKKVTNIINSRDFKKFVNYFNSFYGKNGIYSSGKDIAEKDIMKGLYNVFKRNNSYEWGDGDSVDRELVRDELFKMKVLSDKIYKNEALSVNEAKYDIGMARKGNGITVYNRAEEEKGDYKNIAHISDNGVVKYYDKKLPNDVKKKIEAEAQKMKESVNEGTKMIKLKNLLNESFGFGELPSDKLMKMKVSAKDMLDSINPKKVNEVYEEEDVVEEGRASAKSLLQSVIKGESSRIEGIKLSKKAAEGFLDWLMVSPYGKKFSNLPFHMLLKASFNWGLHRYIDKNSKEYKDLQAVAKTLEKK